MGLHQFTFPSRSASLGQYKPGSCEEGAHLLHPFPGAVRREKKRTPPKKGGGCVFSSPRAHPLSPLSVSLLASCHGPHCHGPLLTRSSWWPGAPHLGSWQWCSNCLQPAGPTPSTHQDSIGLRTPLAREVFSIPSPGLPVFSPAAPLWSQKYTFLGSLQQSGGCRNSRSASASFLLQLGPLPHCGKYHPYL